MIMTAPTVSIILPTFNRLQYLRPAVASVFAQTFDDWELIIADDGSSAETRTFLRTLEMLPRVRLLWLSHTGNPGTVRNAALREAQGEYIAFLDSDDLWLPAKLAIQVKALEACTSQRWSYTAFNRIDDSGSAVFDKRIKQWVPYQGRIFERLLKMEAIVATPTVLARRQLIEAIGGFDEQQAQHEDYDLWLRLAVHNEVQALDTPLACVRTHHEHYYMSGGLRALIKYRRRLIEKMQGLVTDPRLRTVIKKQRALNAAQSANIYAALGERASAVQTLSGSWRFSWPYAGWWLGGTRALLRSLAPGWLVSVYRSGRRRLLQS